MHSLRPEIAELGERGAIDAARQHRAVALDDGSVFSLHLELRIGLYVAVAALLAGVGLFLKSHLEHVGRLTVIIGIGACAALCYAYTERERRRGAGGNHAADYVLLLGALLVSADVAYAESQFRWLGSEWSRYLPMLAVLHGFTAYRYRSSLVLSAALTALAAWLGIEPRFGNVFEMSQALPHAGGRALIGAALMFLWADIHRRARGAPELLTVLEQFTANMALLGALLWCFDPRLRWPGLGLMAIVATAIGWLGVRQKRESLAVYAVLYAALGIGVSVVDAVSSSLGAIIACLLLTATAAMALLAVHANIHRDAL